MEDKLKPLIIESGDGVGDSLSIGVANSRGEVELEIDNPWVGDTESGFGRNASWTLNREQMIKMRDHLIAVLDQMSAT